MYRKIGIELKTISASENEFLAVGN